MEVFKTDSCMKYFTLIIISCLSLSSLGQITVDTSVTPEEAVEELLGENITISNYIFTGADNQVGYFDCVECGFDFTNGVILATGDASVAVGPNDLGAASEGGEFNGVEDADLAQVAAIDTFHDIAAMEFDFVALGDSITFNYTYASEEYHTFINDDGIFDVFLLLISGPGINGPYSNNSENIALVPGTNLAVSNSTINNGNWDFGANATNGPCENCEFFVDNGNGGLDTPQYDDETVVQYNGYTTGLSAVKGGLQCGETYHLRIVIADTSDNSFDSAVIIESNSITSNLTVDVEFNVNVDGYGEGLAEECGTGELLFTRPSAIPSEIPLNISIEYGGDATYGEDYTALPTQLFFGPGVDEILFTVNAFADDLSEGDELVIINVTGAGECGSADVTSNYEFNIVDIQELEIDLINEAQLCGGDTTLVPGVIGGFGDLIYEWTDFSGNLLSSDIDYSLSVPNGGLANLVFSVQDICGNEMSQTVEISNLPLLEIMIPDVITSDCITNNQIIAEANLDLDDIQFSWSSTQSDFTPSSSSIANYQGNESGVISLFADAGCNNSTSVETEIIIIQDPLFLDLLPDTTICFDGVAVLNASASGGTGELIYNWTGNGDEFSTPVINVSPSNSSIYEVQVIDQCGNQISDQNTVEVQHVANSSFSITELANDQFYFEPTLDDNCSSCVLLWTFSDGFETDEFNPVHEFSESGYIGATLTVTSSAGCKSSVTELVNVPAIVYIPNAFTPDNDGINDVWNIEIRGIDQYELSIFNRWGDLVFHSLDPSEVWNGSNLNGDYYVPNGSYSYQLEYRALDSQSYAKTGTVTILR